MLAGLVLCLSSLQETHYVRPTGDRECTFTVRTEPSDWSIESVTERGRTVMTVASRHASDALVGATATFVRGEERRVARVSVAGGRATVTRPKGESREFDVPEGVIVTSAPDWTDTFMLCRRYDPAKGGRQEFPGLWIHPDREPFRLTFVVERKGTDDIEHGGKTLSLVRLELRLRGNSRYAAWVDPDGRMVKLVSLPYGEKSTRLVLEGFRRSTEGLAP